MIATRYKNPRRILDVRDRRGTRTPDREVLVDRQATQRRYGYTLCVVGGVDAASPQGAWVGRHPAASPSETCINLVAPACGRRCSQAGAGDASSAGCRRTASPGTARRSTCIKASRFRGLSALACEVEPTTQECNRHQRALTHDASARGCWGSTMVEVVGRGSRFRNPFFRGVAFSTVSWLDLRVKLLDSCSGKVRLLGLVSPTGKQRRRGRSWV